MTGFGASEGAVLGGRLRIEIRTVNHRYFNAQVKLPFDLAGVEADLRERLRQLLDRGHVAVTARWLESPEAETSLSLDLTRARLTIISVAAEVPGLAYRAGVNVQAMEEEAQAETDKVLREAVDAMPEDLPVTTVHRRGHPGEEIVSQLEAGGHDLLVVGSRGLGRVASNLFGSVGAHVHYHSRVAMLVVQPED